MLSRSKFFAIAAATALAITGLAAAPAAQAVPNTIPVTIQNNSDRNDAVYVYVLGTNLANGQLGWADANGTFHKWPTVGEVPVSAPDASIPGPAKGQAKTIQMPKFSGRIYFSYGQKLDFKIVLDGRLVQPAVQNPTDPNRNILFNWTEYTLNDAGLWINSTQVDFFSAPYQTGLKKADGSIISTGMLKPNGYQGVINSLNGTPGWNNLVQKAPNGSTLRVLNPGHAVGAGQLAPGALDDYINRTWNSYTSRTLTVAPYDYDQGKKFYGHVSGNVMTFTNTAGGFVTSFNKPSSDSVFGCYKDLHAPNDDIGAIARTLCAALNRSTLLSNPNQPDANANAFYQDSVTNYYAKFVHQQMANGRAYAFAFDDVVAQESLVHDGNPTAAYIQLDPFSGTATPIGNSGGNNGGGGDNGGGNNGGGNNGGGNGTGGSLPAGVGSMVAPGNYCVDVPWADPSDGNQVQIVGCSGNPAQVWTRSGDTIKALGKCLDVSGSGVANGTKVQLWTCNGTNAQKWSYNASTKALVNPQSGRCLDAQGGAPLHDGQLLALWDCNNTVGQQFTLNGGVPAGQISGLAAKCIDVNNSGTTNGTKIQLWNCNGTNAQQWTLENDGSIRNRGKCLDIPSGNTANGVKLQLWECNGSNAQKFVVEGKLIKAQASGKCIDVTDNNSANGTPLQMWDCWGESNQQWNVPA